MGRLILVFVAALGLMACNDDMADVYPFTSDVPVVHPEREGALAIAHGVAVGIQPAMIHEEIEGSSALPVTDVRSDDPSIVAVERASSAYSIDGDSSPNGLTWVLVGVAPGQTTLHLYRDDDEVGAVPIDVIGQVQ